MNSPTQKDRLVQYLADHTLARAAELRTVGIAASTISRAVESGEIVRAGRGLYHLSNAEVGSFISFAEASKRIPRGVICMVSALAFHGLTDQMPRKVWIAIGAKDWEPKVNYPPLRIVRFRSPYFESGIQIHDISGVSVPIYSVAKSLADAFRIPRLIDRSVAIECLRNALTSKKATPAEIAKVSQEYGAWRQIRPYLEAITSYG